MSELQRVVVGGVLLVMVLLVATAKAWDVTMLVAGLALGEAAILILVLRNDDRSLS